MNTPSLIKKAVLSAVGVAAYIALVALFFNNAARIFGEKPGVLGSVLMLLLFIISACITGGLVLLRPALLYMDGAKREALRLLAYTIVALAALAVIIAVILIV